MASPDEGVAPPGKAAPLALAWLALPPIATALQVWIAPHVTSAAFGWMLALASVGAIAPAVVATALASRARPTLAHSILLAIAGGAGIAALYARSITSGWWLVATSAAIVALSSGVGGLIGSRVQHAGHVLPAAFVAAAADLASVLHPSGVSNQIASDTRALSVLALGAPVFGTDGIAFALGVGDVTFAALLFAVAVRHGVSLLRVTLAVAVAIVLALAAAALLERPIPALVTIGACAVVSVPAFREVRRADRAVTQVAIAVSLAVAIGMIVRTALGG